MCTCNSQRWHASGGFSLDFALAIWNLNAPDPPRRHGRVLRVGRAARRPVAAGKAGGGGRIRPTAAGVVARRQLRGAPVRRAVGDADGARRAPLPAPRHRPARVHASTGACRRRSSRCYREVTPLVEPLSLDEAYLDVTENAWGEPLGRTRGRAAEGRHPREDRPDGVGGRRARTSSSRRSRPGWKKPDGLTVIAPERVERFLQGLPIDALWGVGPVTAARLRSHGIEKLVDVRAIAGRRPAARSSAAWRRGCSSWPTASTIARSSRTARPSRRAARTRSTAT